MVRYCQERYRLLLLGCAPYNTTVAGIYRNGKGVELHGHHSQRDNGATTSASAKTWDAQLEIGTRITSLIGIDDSYANLINNLQRSVAWLDGPLTEHNLIPAIKGQRVISAHKLDYVWFDIGGVPVESDMADFVDAVAKIKHNRSELCF